MSKDRWITDRADNCEGGEKLRKKIWLWIFFASHTRIWSTNSLSCKQEWYDGCRKPVMANYCSLYNYRVGITDHPTLKSGCTKVYTLEEKKLYVMLLLFRKKSGKNIHFPSSHDHFNWQFRPLGIGSFSLRGEMFIFSSAVRQTMSITQR